MNKNLAIVGAHKYGQTVNLTASSQQVGAEVGFLNDLRRFYPWKSMPGVVTNVDLFWDFGATVLLDALVLGGTNLSLFATRQFWAGTDPIFASNLWTVAPGPAFDTSAPTLREWKPPWGRDVIVTNPTPVSVRYAKLRISDSSNPDGFLSADFNVPDLAWQPVRNYNVKFKNPDMLVGASGVKQLIRSFSCDLPALTRAEKSQLRSLLRDLKDVGRVYLLPSPSRPEEFLESAILGTFVEATDFNGVDRGGRFLSVSLKFQETDI